MELDSLVYNGKVLLALLITALSVINDSLENIFDVKTASEMKYLGLKLTCTLKLYFK